tara:strand:- start:41 stop:406 length:366 start_codon:yes stop_codon:yes gene_type:complete
MVYIPLRDNSADGILSIASFHHLATVERRMKALTEMKRLLKTDGIILLSVWSIRQPKKLKKKYRFHFGDNIVKWTIPDGETYDRYYYIFSVEELYHLFNIAGLNVIKHFWEYGNEVFIIRK